MTGQKYSLKSLLQENEVLSEESMLDSQGSAHDGVSPAKVENGGHNITSQYANSGGGATTWQELYEAERKKRVETEKKLRWYEDQSLRERDRQQTNENLKKQLNDAKNRAQKNSEEYGLQIAELRAKLESKQRALAREQAAAESDAKNAEEQMQRQDEVQRDNRRRALEQTTLEQNQAALESDLIQIRRMLTQRESDIQQFQAKMVDDMVMLQTGIDELRRQAAD